MIQYCTNGATPVGNKRFSVWKLISTPPELAALLGGDSFKALHYHPFLRSISNCVNTAPTCQCARLFEEEN
jgi:hypothetical protein